MFPEPLVAAAEVAVGKKAAAGGAERARVRPVEVEQRAGAVGGAGARRRRREAKVEPGDELLGGPAPGDKHKGAAGALAGPDKLAHNGGNEVLPAALGVGVCSVCLDGETGVEKQHAFAGPGSEVAVGGRHEVRVVVAESLEDVDEGGRDAGVGVADGEGEAVGLVVVVVGVLADD